MNTERVIMVRESTYREMREALREMLTVHEAHHNHPVHAAARAALAKSEAAATQPVAYAYVVAGECEQIEWGTDVDLPDDPALVWLYPHPTPDGCGREGKHALTDIMEDAREDTLRRHPARRGPFVIEDGDLEGGDDG